MSLRYICNAESIQNLMHLASPIIVTALIQEACQISTLIYVGRLKNAEFIGAATLGNMVCNITGYSLAYGMCSVLDTLISQAYGAKKYKLLGLYTQRAVAILTLSCLPVLFIWNQTEFILRHLLLIPQVEASLAGLWSRILCLGLWPSVMFEILRKFLQGQNIVWPVVIATSFGTIFNICCNYYLIFYRDWGFQGAAFTVPLTNWFQFTILGMVILIRKGFLTHQGVSNPIATSQYTLVSTNIDSSLDETAHGKAVQLTKLKTNRNRNDNNDNNKNNKNNNKISSNTSTPDSKLPDHTYDDFDSILDDSINSNEDDAFYDATACGEESNPEDNWPEISREIFDDWPQFLRLGIPGAVSLFIEWGSYELASGLAGQLGSVRLAAHGIFSCTAGIFYMLPQAVALSAATLIGNLLGAGDFEGARNMVNLGLTIDFSYGLVAGFSLFFLCRSWWGPVFSNNVAVQGAIYDMMPVMACYSCLDAFKCISLNILRSTGRPNVTVYVNTFVCVCCMLPLGYFLGIYCGFGLNGIWGGMTISWAIAAVIYFVILYRTDWSQQVLVSKD